MRAPAPDHPSTTTAGTPQPAPAVLPRRWTNRSPARRTCCGPLKNQTERHHPTRNQPARIQPPRVRAGRPLPGRHLPARTSPAPRPPDRTHPRPRVARARATTRANSDRRVTLPSYASRRAHRTGRTRSSSLERPDRPDAGPAIHPSGATSTPGSPGHRAETALRPAACRRSRPGRRRHPIVRLGRVPTPRRPPRRTAPRCRAPW